MIDHFPSQRKACPADILLLIFEELHFTAPASLHNVRLASRQFNVLVEPIVYRHLKVNKAILQCFKERDETYDPPELVNARKRVRSAMCTFTRRIAINKAFDWSSVVNMLLCLDQFHHLNWSFWRRESSSVRRSNCIPQDILDCLTEHWPSATFSLDTTNSSTSESIDAIQSLPPTNLISLTLQKDLRRRFNPAVGTLKKVLHLLALCPGSRFVAEDIEECEKLPHINQLVLQGHCWLHCPKIANSFWNWSRLTSLKLEKVFIIDFLESVLPENLIQLRSFVTDGHCESAGDQTKVSVLGLMHPRVVPRLRTSRLVSRDTKPSQSRSLCRSSAADFCRPLILSQTL